MRRLIEKLLIIALCLYNAFKIDPTKELVIYFLIAFVLSLSLDLFSKKKTRISIYFIFLLLTLYFPSFLYYLPLILYNLYMDFGLKIILLIPILLMNFSLVALLATCISIYLSAMTKNFDRLQYQNKIVRDELKENNIYLKKYNEQLKIDREKNIHIAILTERNRIARELHDSIGHTLSSCILQVEALKIISNNSLAESLDLLQNTLHNGMDDIRNSIHNLYNESFDLKDRIQRICDEILNLNIQLDYKLQDNLPYELKFDILSVIREAITNCVKHSNATELKIKLLNQPNFYSIIIKDNGSDYKEIDKLSSKGIGLLSMEEISRKYNGYFNYEFQNGFKIHLTLMKG